MNIISAVLITTVATFASSAIAAETDLSKLPPASKTTGLTYAKDVRPIFEASCFRCHGQQRPKAGLRLDSLEGVLKGSEDGKVIIPGKSQESQLVLAVARVNEKTAMPPKPRGRPPGAGGPPPNAPVDGKAPARPDGVPDGGPHKSPPPAPKPLTTEQVGIIRAWVDQGAK
jgi:mono/diheme cytochrome c family protein